VVAVDRLSFAVPAGTTTALLGANGAGKTTTIAMMLGLLAPSAGRILVLGEDMLRHRYRVLGRINFSSPYVDLPLRLTVRQNLSVYAELYGLGRPGQKIDRLVGELDLQAFVDRATGKLSAGQKTRVMLAKALINDPEVLFLDEPTAGLDPAARAATWELVRQLAAQGATVLLTTQLIEEAERVAERVAILDRGRLVAAGTPSELIHAASARQLIFRAVRGIDPDALGTALGAPVEVDANTPANGLASYRVLADPDPAMVARLAAWLSERGTLLEELHVGGGTLEQVFLGLTSADHSTAPPAGSSGREHLTSRRRGQRQAAGAAPPGDAA
jgi:ABC-2 type transport system ATP-binding protein